VDDEAPAGAGHHRGVTVMVSELDREFRSLSNPGVTNELAQIFALYLRQHPTVQIYYAGTLIDPHSVEDTPSNIRFPQSPQTTATPFNCSIRKPTRRFRIFIGTLRPPQRCICWERMYRRN
jgi:hypothetical protein